MQQTQRHLVGRVGRGKSLGAVVALACLTACGCPEERCGPTPQLLLTVRTGDSLVPDAVATVLPEGDPFVSNGCARAGRDWGCTHELLTIPGREELRTDGAGGGRGGWQPGVEIPVRIRVATGEEQAPHEFDVTVPVDACGFVQTPNVVIDFGGTAPSVAVERGPHGCERPGP